MTHQRISAKASRFTESVIREMNRLAVAAGAVSLAQGFPDFACPPELKEAAAAAVHDDLNQYAITWGAKPLRDAIAESTVRHFPATSTGPVPEACRGTPSAYPSGTSASVVSPGVT